MHHSHGDRCSMLLGVTNINYCTVGFLSNNHVSFSAAAFTIGETLPQFLGHQKHTFTGGHVQVYMHAPAAV